MIQIELTPNPDSLKFLSEKTISAIGTEEFQKSKIAQDIKKTFPDAKLIDIKEED